MPNGHSTLSLLSRPGLIPTRHSRPTQWTSLPLSAACPIHAAAEQKVGNLEDSALGLIPGQPHTASGLRWGVRPQSPFRFPISTFTAHPVRLSAPPCGPGFDGLSFRHCRWQVECFCIVPSVSYPRRRCLQACHKVFGSRPVWTPRLRRPTRHSVYRHPRCAHATRQSCCSPEP